MNQPISTLLGELSSAPTAAQQDMPFTNAGEESTLGMLGQTAPTSPISQVTGTSLGLLPNGGQQRANALAMRMLMAFANQLKAHGMVEWRVCKLKDGRVGWALFFPAPDWAKSNDEIVPTR